MALCLRIACVIEDRSLRVQVDGVWHTCEYKGQQLTTSANKERIVCPDPIRVCPTFYCPRDCLGTNLLCDYTLGACVCSATVGEETIVSLPLDDGSCLEYGKPPTDPTLEEGGPTDESSSGSGDPDPSNGGSGDSTKPPVKEPEQSNFYIPPEQADVDPSLPQNGSVLDDIYFPDERTLEEQGDDEEEDPNNWNDYGGGASEWRMGLISVVFLLLPAVYYWKQHEANSASGNDDANDGDGPTGNEVLPQEIRRNKDKMIATVLVDLRMNDPQSFHDVLVQRGSETDRSMTDTDGGTFVPWEDQLSARDFPSTIESVESASSVNGSALESTTEEPIPEHSPSRGTGSIRRRLFRRRENSEDETPSPAQSDSSGTSSSSVNTRASVRHRRFFRRRRNNNSQSTSINRRRNASNRGDRSGLGSTLTL